MYSVTLFDARGISAADQRQAEDIFRATVDAILGGPDGVVAAYRAFCAAMDEHEELPLPANATDSDRAAVARWEEAERAGERAAFAGWVGNTGGAHFALEC